MSCVTAAGWRRARSQPASAPRTRSVKLKHFAKFSDMKEALGAATAAVEGKLGKRLKKVLRKVFAADLHEQLAVADTKLGGAIKVTHDDAQVNHLTHMHPLSPGQTQHLLRPQLSH